MICFVFSYQVHDIEFAQIESKVVEGLKSGNEALKKMHQLMSIEDVERIMDETAEAVEYQQVKLFSITDQIVLFSNFSEDLCHDLVISVRYHTGVYMYSYMSRHLTFQNSLKYKGRLKWETTLNAI